MGTAKTITARIVLGLALLSIGLLVTAPNSSATATTFGVTASGSVNGVIFQNCGGSNGGDGFVAATFSCGTTAGSVMASGDFGAVSLRSEADNIQADAVASLDFYVQGTIGGSSPNGTMTWTDGSISGTPGSDVFITIFTRGGPFGDFVTVLGSSCFGASQPGCGTGASISANAPITNGEPIELDFQANCGAGGENSLGQPQPLPQICRLGDPFSLSLSNGLTFNSDVPNLFAPGTGTTPEPASLLLLGSGILGLGAMRRRFANRTAQI